MSRTADDLANLGVGRGEPVSPQGQSPLALGTNANAIRFTKIDLTAARTNVKLPLAGNVIAGYGSSAPLAYAQVSLRPDNEDKVTVRDGLILRGVPFTELRMTHVAQPQQYLGLITAVDARGIFDLQLPPPITLSTLHQSGWGFQRRRFVSGVLAENAVLAIANNTDPVTGWVGILHGSSLSSGQHRVIMAATNAALEAEANMQAELATSLLSTFANYGQGDVTNRRLPQMTVLFGTTALGRFADGAFSDSDGSGRYPGWTHSGDMEIVLPGYHAAWRHTTTNTSLIVNVHWAELPITLWRN